MSSTNGAYPARESRKDPTAPSRVELLRWRLSYARAGTRTSPADAQKKKPALKGWQELATTDPRRIHAESNGASPPFDAILTPTGSRDRRMVLDEDVEGEIAKLEEELGIPLRGTTTEVTTPSGRPHLHFSLPEGVEVSGSVGKNFKDGFEGLDIRGRGNQVLLPPSPGYSFANRLPMAEAPPELIAWAQGRKKPTPIVAKKTLGIKTHEPGEFVPKHSRNAAMISFLGRKHDGTRSMGDLIAEGLAYRDTCFEEPSSYPDAQIVKEARWTFGLEPCRPRRKGREPDPEVEEALEACSRYWYAERLPGGGRSLLRNVYRACLMSAAKRSEIGEAITDDGEVRTGPMFSESTRQLGEVVNADPSSVSRHLNHLEELGPLVKVAAPLGLSPTYVLTLPREATETTPRTRNTATPPNQPPASPIGERLERGVAEVRADALRVPFFRWGGIVSNSDAGVLAALEGIGPMTSGDLAGRLKISRPRDLERRRLRKLEEMGLVENNGERWGLVEDYAAVADALWHEQYATVRRRRVRTRTDEGRTVTEVEESVTVASDAERVEAMKEKHRQEREVFAQLRRKAEERAEEEQRQEDGIRDLLNAWDDEREGLAADEADGLIGELEPIEEVPEGPVVAPDRRPEVQEPSFAGTPVRTPVESSRCSGDHLSELARSLRDYLELCPHRAHETPSWLANYAWSEGLVGWKPTPEETAWALAELRKRRFFGEAA